MLLPVQIGGGGVPRTLKRGWWTGTSTQLKKFSTCLPYRTVL